MTEPPTGSDTIGTDHSDHFALSAPASSNLLIWGDHDAVVSLED